MGPGHIGSSPYRADSIHEKGVIRHIGIHDLDRELQNVKLKEESTDAYIKATKEELALHDKRARRYVKLTDYAGNSVKPLAVASLIGMGINPLFGLIGSIAVLATAFVFRNHLYKENASLQRAHTRLNELEQLKVEISHQKSPLERMQKELEWVKKAAEIAQDLHKNDDITVEDGYLEIGGIKLEINRNNQ